MMRPVWTIKCCPTHCTFLLFMGSWYLTDLQSWKMMYTPPTWSTTGLSCCTLKCRNWHARQASFHSKPFVFFCFIFLDIQEWCLWFTWIKVFLHAMSSSSLLELTSASYTCKSVSLCCSFVCTCTLWHNTVLFICITTALSGCVIIIHFAVRIHTPLSLCVCVST